jgi:chromosome segregation ATPase
LASNDVTKELQSLEEKLAALRARMEEEESAFSDLEGQLRELSGQLTLRRREITDFEGLVEDKREELTDAQYRESLRSREEAADRLAAAASQVVAELEAYDRAREAFETLAIRKGADATDRPDDLDVLGEPWQQLVEAVRERINEQFDDELVEAASRSVQPGAIDALPAHLREAARERARARLRQPRSGRGE